MLESSVSLSIFCLCVCMCVCFMGLNSHVAMIGNGWLLGIFRRCVCNIFTQLSKDFTPVTQNEPVCLFVCLFSFN